MANIQVTWITQSCSVRFLFTDTWFYKPLFGRLVQNSWICVYAAIATNREDRVRCCHKKIRPKGLGLMHASLQPTLFVCQYVSQLIVRPSMSHFAFLGTQWWFLHHCHASLVDSTNLCVSQSVCHILLFTWFFWYHCSCSNGLLTISIVPAHAVYLTYLGSGPKGDNVL